MAFLLEVLFALMVRLSRPVRHYLEPASDAYGFAFPARTSCTSLRHRSIRLLITHPISNVSGPLPSLSGSRYPRGRRRAMTAAITLRQSNGTAREVSTWTNAPSGHALGPLGTDRGPCYHGDFTCAKDYGARGQVLSRLGSVEFCTTHGMESKPELQ